jgi:hypothetical protein
MVLLQLQRYHFFCRLAETGLPGQFIVQIAYIVPHEQEHHVKTQFHLPGCTPVFFVPAYLPAPL